jgi:gliding motility-associated-like protein
MKKILYIFFFAAAGLLAQTNVPPPQVLNAAGGTAKVNGYYYGYNIGEPVVGTGKTAANYYTQGFLQPDYKIGTAFNASVYYTNESCEGASDGSIVANPYNSHGPVTYSLSPAPSLGDTTSSMVNLPPGTYTLTIKDSIGNTLSKKIVINPSYEICPITVHHAFSPNNDGLNDTYIIDGIENYSDNHVYFFNRWGQLIWDHAKYDNTTVVWNGKDNKGNEIVVGTYFYIIDIKGNKPYKGWVQITK